MGHCGLPAFSVSAKQGTQHDQGHVMVPGIPAPDLIVGQSTFLLGFPETVLDKEALRLYSGQGGE
jgi:hypothetical protein